VCGIFYIVCMLYKRKLYVIERVRNNTIRVDERKVHKRIVILLFYEARYVTEPEKCCNGLIRVIRVTLLGFDVDSFRIITQSI
jgi:hypothetical protein